MKPMFNPGLLNDFITKVKFRFYLPNLKIAKVDGVKLNLEGLSSYMKNVILSGRYEHQEKKFCNRVIASEDVVLELGSAIGFIGLYCRKVLGVRHVTSVEANPRTLSMLKRNYALNDLSPHAVHAAAADKNGEIDLDVGGEFWENSVESKTDGAETVTVPARTLDSICEEMPAQPTVFICDIEGAEKYLDLSKLPETVRTIIIEIHPEVIGKEESARIVSDLEDFGFALEEFEDRSYLFCR